MNFEASRSKVIIQLLKGPLYREQTPGLWHDFLKYQEEIQAYFSHLGLTLFSHQDYGFAFLRQDLAAASEEEPALPRLVQQRELSFELSVLLVLLRKRLAEHDKSSGEPRLVIDEKDILQSLKVFLKDTNNEVQQRKEVSALIEKAIDIGVLRRLNHDEQKLEVLRVLAALFDATRLDELNSRLLEYEIYAKQST